MFSSAYIVNKIKKHWALIAVILIISLSMHLRLLDYRWPYLRNIDSYMFYRQMDEIIQNNGVYPAYDIYVRAPEGEERTIQGLLPQMYPYQHLGAYSFMFFKMFFPGLQLWQYLIYLPAFLASLMAIPAYLIGRLIYDKRAGVLAAFFMVFDITIVSRTLGGDPDSDALQLLVSLIVLTIFLYTYKYIEVKKALDKRAILYSVLTGISLGVWSHTWIGYWYIVWIILGTFILKVVIESVMKRRPAFKENVPLALSYLIFFSVFLLLFILPVYGINRVAYTFLGPLEFQDIKGETGRQFPNVGVSVAELQGSGSLKEIIQRSSAVDFSQNPLAILFSPFVIMIYTMFYLGYSFVKTKKHFVTLLVLLIWFAGPILASLVAVRFSILFSQPIAIGLGIFFSKISRMASGEGLKE